MKNKKIVKILLITALIVLLTPLVSFASSVNYGENFGKIILDNLFWIIIVIGIVISVVQIMKHATSSVIITIILTGLFTYLCKNPTVFDTIGTNIWGSIFQ